MPYATNGGISQADQAGKQGWIQITPEQYLEALEGIKAGKVINVDDGFRLMDPAPPENPSNPDLPTTAVTAAQGGIALIRMGLMDAVQEAVASPDTPPGVRWAWDKATVWDKSSPALAYLADKAGITAEQMDELFDLAKTIVA